MWLVHLWAVTLPTLKDCSLVVFTSGVLHTVINQSVTQLCEGGKEDMYQPRPMSDYKGVNFTTLDDQSLLHRLSQMNVLQLVIGRLWTMAE